MYKARAQTHAYEAVGGPIGIKLHKTVGEHQQMLQTACHDLQDCTAQPGPDGMLIGDGQGTA